MTVFDGQVNYRGQGRTARMLFRALGCDADEVLVIVPTQENVERTIAFLRVAAPCIELIDNHVVRTTSDGRRITVVPEAQADWYRLLYDDDATFISHRCQSV